MTDDITEDDLIDAIREHLERPDETGDREPGTITRPELQEHFNLSRGSTYSLLMRLVTDCVLTHDYVWRRDAWGDSTKRRGYRYIGGEHDTHTETG